MDVGTIARVDVLVAYRARWLVVRDEVPVRPGRGVDLRGQGLWLSLVDEGDGRWTIGLEVFALGVDDPADERGDLVPLGFDLEWEPPGQLHGELLIGDEAFEIDAAATLDVS